MRNVNLLTLLNSLTYLNLAAAASGVGFAVITTVPNTIVTLYHEVGAPQVASEAPPPQNPSLYYGAAAGKAGVGADIAILDTGYYLSQVSKKCPHPKSPNQAPMGRNTITVTSVIYSILI